MTSISAFLRILAESLKPHRLAAYDPERFKPGWKGKFIVQKHEADRAGPHWDVRLEWPVKSAEGAGSVFRSFVDRKMEIPGGDTKIYLVETEDHPMEYGSFEGEITEGYGKGTVDIWDKGTYEVLDTGSGRIVARFNGKKLKGVYALVKYAKGYLW